ncbi:protein trichome birefringence-like 10 [Andrographis paniculata]|uniref:protein trichome birefringence-like 10 n=1 Tax=Andrographis paniculata TaxID=175694 RepID=UPI0021E908DA|nr:protein trichome birefringence-like 10 [Andrographis paniculata]
MSVADYCKKMNRRRLPEPAVGIIGLTLCLILCFYVVNYGGLRRLVGIDFPGSGDEKIDFPGGGGGGEECDVFDGDWVWDEKYPLYESRNCRFLDEGFRCSENGRPDSYYTKWRWQPKRCNLPRFDGKMMLEKMRNKRIVFAGDSIGRNQWESLLCMLAGSGAGDEEIYEVHGNPITKHKGFLVFKFARYNTTVEYYRAPFLVLQSRPPANSPSGIRTTLKLDQMDWTSRRWKDADVLVLNTGHWWNREKTIRLGCYFQERRSVETEMSVDGAYRKALDTVLGWIRREVNTSHTQVVFRTYAPVHFRGGDWSSGGTCHLETLPDTGSSLVPAHTWDKYNIFVQVLSSHHNTSNLDVLDITHLTSRRRDGHSSLYYLGAGVGLAPRHRQDCSHWCLPGVPDTWNELLYAVVLNREARKMSNSTGFRAHV